MLLWTLMIYSYLACLVFKLYLPSLMMFYKFITGVTAKDLKIFSLCYILKVKIYMGCFWKAEIKQFRIRMRVSRSNLGGNFLDTVRWIWDKVTLPFLVIWHFLYLVSFWCTASTVLPSSFFRRFIICFIYY